MPKRPSDIPLDFASVPHEALVNLWWTATLMRRQARRFFREHDLSEADFNALMVLRHSRTALSQQELSERLLVDKANVTGVIDRLETQGLVQREPDPDDRRRYQLGLTRAGRQRVDAIDPRYHTMVTQVMAGLDERECRRLIDLTRKMRRGLASMEDDGI